MLFNSLHFLIFLPIVVILYFKTPYKYRWILLAIASSYFYMSWKAEYIILILISAVVDFLAGNQIYKAKTKSKKLTFLIISLCSNLGLLFAFKYFNFFSESVSNLFSSPAPYLNVLLPVGISFYTFQTLSYSLDIYRGKIKPETHFGIFFVYVSFFPQLVAGPIERAKNLLPQFFEKHDFNYDSVVSGIKLMLWGFFKKMVIADRLAVVVNTIYNNPTGFTGLPLIVGTVFFAFQIFCDFSGYSDIAIGTARLMGFKLSTNFNRPYFAKSVGEFWRRWHISLSSWFRDYVYIPLGGNRRYINILIVFLISGLWHGANWTFVIWGLMHGVYLMIERKLKIKLPVVISILITFLFVNLAWVMFRANSLSDAIYIYSNLLNITTISGVNLGADWIGLGIIIFFIICMEIVHLTQENTKIGNFIAKYSFIKTVGYIILALSILIFGVFDKTPFVYFQF